MSYMLDTNICIYIIKKRPEQVLQKFTSFNPGDICISSITLSELLFGVEKSQHPQRNKAALEAFILPLDILPFEADAAHHYGRIRVYLEQNGVPIGPMDLMIAAHAQATHSILVTNNIREFSRVPELYVENWVD